MKHNKNKGSKVPNLRFPEFEGQWEISKLKDICTLTKGAGISKDQLSADGIPCVLYGELYTKYKSEVIRDIFSRTNICDSNLVRSKANDVIIPSSGESAIDIATVRCIPYDGVLLGGDLNIIRLIEHNGSFFSYQLNGARKREIAKVAQGVSVVHLYGEGLKNLTVFYPSNAEQDKIAMFLSLIDERISTQNKIIAHLESLIKGLCLDLYERCEKIPYKISEIGHKHTTINLSKEELSDNGHNCIIYGELFTTYGCVIDVVQSKTTKNCTPKSLSKGNDILFPSSTTVDATSLISPSALKEVGVVLGGDMFSINVNNSHNCEAISYIINNVLKNKLARYAQGSTIIHIYYDDIKDYTLMLPVKEKQDLLANIMHCISTKISTEKDILSFYLQQKGYLLQNMFM